MEHSQKAPLPPLWSLQLSSLLTMKGGNLSQLNDYAMTHPCMWLAQTLRDARGKKGAGAATWEGATWFISHFGLRLQICSFQQVTYDFHLRRGVIARTAGVGGMVAFLAFSIFSPRHTCTAHTPHAHTDEAGKTKDSGLLAKLAKKKKKNSVSCQDRSSNSCHLSGHTGRLVSIWRQRSQTSKQVPAQPLQHASKSATWQEKRAHSPLLDYWIAVNWRHACFCRIRWVPAQEMTQWYEARAHSWSPAIALYEHQGIAVIISEQQFPSGRVLVEMPQTCAVWKSLPPVPSATQALR